MLRHDIMEPLVQLVREYQHAVRLEDRMLLAEEIIRRVGPDLKAFFHRCWPPEQAQDVAHDALVAIAGGLKSVHAKTDKEFWSWCYRIARHKHADLCRKISTDKADLFDPQEMEQTVEASAVPVPIGAGERLDLEYARKLLEATEPPCVDYLWRYYILDWDYGDIAEAYGVKYDTIRRRIERCLELARKLMAKHP